MCSIQYFPHDVWASNDTKLKRVKSRFGMEGIGVFWEIIQALYREGGKIQNSDIDLIEMDCPGVPIETIKSIIEDFDLFVLDGKTIQNKRVNQFLKQFRNKSNQFGKQFGHSKKQFRNKSNQFEDQFEEQIECKTSKRGAPKGNRNACKQRSCSALDNEAVVEVSENNSKSIQINSENNSESQKNNSKSIQINSETNPEPPIYKKEKDKIIYTTTEPSLHSGSCPLGGDAPSEPKPTKKKKEVDFEAVLAQWAEHCPRLSQPRTLNEKRKHKIALRLDEMDRDGIELSDVLQHVGRSNFLNGESGSWRASFDWLFDNDSNWRKVVEGNYDNRDKTSQPRGGGTAQSSKNVNDVWEGLEK